MKNVPVQRIGRADDLEVRLFGRLSPREKVRGDRLAAEAGRRRVSSQMPRTNEPLPPEVLTP
jgi:hypothetical protein